MSGQNLPMDLDENQMDIDLTENQLRTDPVGNYAERISTSISNSTVNFDVKTSNGANQSTPNWNSIYNFPTMNNGPLSMARKMEIIRKGNVIEKMKILSLEGCHSNVITGLTNEFVNLIELNLHGLQLTTLQGFPVLPNLRRLKLSYNFLSNGLELLLTSPQLQFLDISQNIIHSFDELRPLRFLRNLQYFAFIPHRLQTPDQFCVRMTDAIFDLMPELQYFDGFGRNGDILRPEIAFDLGYTH